MAIPMPTPSPAPTPPAKLALSVCRPCMYLENDDSAFSDMTSASERKRVVSFSSTPANASNDNEREASRLWHMDTCASATSSRISPNTDKTLVISSPTLSLRSFMTRAVSSSSPGDSPPDSDAWPPFTPPGGFRRQALDNLRVASAIRAPHLPNVRARADMSLRVSVSTIRFLISRSMYDCRYGESEVKEGVAELCFPSSVFVVTVTRRDSFIKGGGCAAAAIGKASCATTATASFSKLSTDSVAIDPKSSSNFWAVRLAFLVECLWLGLPPSSKDILFRAQTTRLDLKHRVAVTARPSLQ
mmetsp:Transcript_22555/g.53244  ORF Transcript_22555/g.53244 Transcript_22555/m.53244 type:complete len:301 (+) Transcript_22555:553-1455(+)